MKIRWDYITIILLLILLFFVAFNGCSWRPETVDSTTTTPAIKNEIKAKKAKKDTIHAAVLAAEATRTVYITKWKTLKDTIVIPSVCDTIVKIVISKCDSALASDSVLIARQASEILTDNSIITKHEDLDVAREKQSKKEKRRLRILAITSAVIAVVAIMKN